MRFIDAEQASDPITMLCRLVDVSRAGYYAWAQRGSSERAQADATRTEAIRSIHAQSRQTYGLSQVHATRRAQGQRVSHKRVARLLRAAGAHDGEPGVLTLWRGRTRLQDSAAAFRRFHQRR